MDNFRTLENSTRIFRIEDKTDETAQSELWFFDSKEQVFELFPDAVWGGKSGASDKVLLTSFLATPEEIELLGLAYYPAWLNS